MSLRLRFLWMDDSYESEKVVHAFKSPLKGLIVSFGSFARDPGEEEDPAVGPLALPPRGVVVGGAVGEEQ